MVRGPLQSTSLACVAPDSAKLQTVARELTLARGRHRPSAVTRVRQLRGELIVIAAIPATLIIERIGRIKSVEDLARGAWARKWRLNSLPSPLQ